MKKIFLTSLAVLPAFIQAQNLNQKSTVEPDSVHQPYEYNIVIDTVETMIIRQDDAQIEYLYREQTREEAQHLAKTQPKEEPKGKKKKSSVTITEKGYSSVYLVDTQHGSGKSVEIRLSAGLYKGIGEFVDTNAGMMFECVYNVNFNWGVGIESGYIYSATPYGVNFVPAFAMIDYNFDNLNGFVPFVEFYGGPMFGISQSNVKLKEGTKEKDLSHPNCGAIGGKLGCSYTFKCNISLRVAVDYYHTMESSNKTYSDTSVSCLGPSGSIAYKF